MKIVTIITLLLSILIPVFGDDLADVQGEIEYRKGRILKLEEEIKEMQDEIAGYDAAISGGETSAPGDPASYSDVLKKALKLELELEGRSTVLERMKNAFIEKVPFKKGENLGGFADVKGRKFYNAVVSTVGSDEVEFVHASGTDKLKSSDFPVEFRPDWNRRPVTEDISNIGEVATGTRPSSVLKTAVYAKRRDDLSRQRAESHAATKDSVVSSSNVTLRDPSQREADRARKDQEAAQFNRNVEKEIAAKEVQLKSTHQELSQLELQFMKDTMAYDSMKPPSSMKARDEEHEKRAKIIDTYEANKSRLKNSIGTLERELFDLISSKKTEFNLPASNELSIEERKKEVERVRAKVGEMEAKLKTTYDALYKVQDERAEVLQTYQSTNVKPDRRTFELKMEAFNTEIIRFMAETSKMEEEIRDTKNSIPRI